MNSKYNPTKKEEYIDMVIFKDMASSGNFTIKEIAEKFNISNRNIRNICDRCDINLNAKSNLFEPEDHDQFIQFVLEYGKQKAANKYNTTLASVTGWCRRHGVSIPKYNGLKRNDIEIKTEDIVSLYNFGYSLDFIADKFETSRPTIKRILTTSGINLRNQFDLWKADKDFVYSNIEQYHQDNIDGMSLLSIAEKHNISYEHLKSAFKDNNISVKIHSYNKSKGELELKNYLESIQDNLVYSTKNIHNDKQYELDCVIENINFSVEYCGEYWHSYNAGKHRKYHYDKFIWAKEQDIKLMTIFEHEWLTKQDLIKSMINHRIGLSVNTIYARNTKVHVIPTPLAKEFHNRCHMNGGLNASSLDIGLFKEGVLVSVASFCKSRFSKEAEYELLRYSTELNTNIVGGFGKLFKYFLILQNNPSIISYCDLRFGEGNVYRKTGFEYIGTTPPNYWYYYKNSGPYGKLESRMKYQKHKLVGLDNYDKTKTEYQIMAENGYLKIFDCGNHKYLYKKGG